MAKKEERFVKVYSENMGCEMILVDKKTGVNYLFVQSGYAGGLTPLLNSDGKPVVTPISSFMDET
ncbi:MAG: xylan 1,4-beta-xylosidase [Firmicutes bacterium]|nr:xylan 1,4-beta-xylosidase [Bacillota bacterium]